MQLKYSLITTLSALLLSGLYLGTYARTETVDTTLVLHEVVVTGSRTERPVTQSPGSISIVSPVLLRNTPAQSVDDLRCQYHPFGRYQ